MSLTLPELYALTGCGLFVIGLHAFVMQPHPLKKILALNIAGSGVLLILVAVAYHGPGAAPDPVPHAMVLTGIVVAVCATAVALVLIGRVTAISGKVVLEEQLRAETRDP